jgi:hypothetical protein
MLLTQENKKLTIDILEYVQEELCLQDRQITKILPKK